MSGKHCVNDIESSHVKTASRCNKLKRWFRLFWRYVVIIATPFICLPLIIVGQNQVAYCGFLLIVMAVYWATEALPLSATSLIPIFYLPFAGIMPASAVTPLYMQTSTMMFFTAVTVALSLERVGIHKRVAIIILQIFGGNVKWLLLSIILPTWFFSLWISNTATSAMMLPCTLAILTEIEHSQKATQRESSTIDTTQHKYSTYGSIQQEQLINDTTYQAYLTDGDTQEAQAADGAIQQAFATDAEIQQAYQSDDIILQAYQSYDFIQQAYIIDDDQQLIHVNDEHYNKKIADVQTDLSVTKKNYEQAGLYSRESNSDKICESHKVINSCDKTKKKQPNNDEEFISSLSKAFPLSIAYAARIGGVGTLTGTAPNLIMKTLADSIWQSHGYPESPINFATWMIMGFPTAILNLICLLLWMQFYFIGFRKTFDSCFTTKTQKIENPVDTENAVRAYILSRKKKKVPTATLR